MDEIANDPPRAADLSPTIARVLYHRAVIVLAALAPALAADVPTEPARDVEPGDRLLTADEAARLYGVEVKWLQRHPRLPFVRKLGHRTVRYSEKGLRRWLAAQRP